MNIENAVLEHESPKSYGGWGERPREPFPGPTSNSPGGLSAKDEALKGKTMDRQGISDLVALRKAFVYFVCLVDQIPGKSVWNCSLTRFIHFTPAFRDFRRFHAQNCETPFQPHDYALFKPYFTPFNPKRFIPARSQQIPQIRFDSTRHYAILSPLFVWQN
jgi:hypothetical protein